MILSKKNEHPEFALVDTQNEICCTDYTTSLQKLQDEINKKFTVKREQTDILGFVYNDLDMQNRARRVLDCGSFLEFKVTPEKAKLQHANFCKDRLCPMCNWRRSLKIFSQVSTVMDKMPDNYQYLFLTLTVKNCSGDDLPKTIQALYDGWRNLYHDNKIFKKVIKGTFRSVECTIKIDDSYHPHLHIILAVLPSYFKKDYISQAKWTEMWQKACGLDYNPIVHIEKCYLLNDEGKKEKVGIDFKKAVAEATKYAVKGSEYLKADDIDFSSKAVSSLLNSLSGRRLCGWTGIFNEIRKQLKLDDAENGDLIHTDTDEVREDVACMIVRYGWRAGAYCVID